MTQREFEELKQDEDNHDTSNRNPLSKIMFIEGLVAGEIPLAQITMKGDRILVTQLPQKIGVLPMKELYKWRIELTLKKAIDFYHNKVYKSTYKYRPYVVRNKKKLAERESKKREGSQD